MRRQVVTNGVPQHNPVIDLVIDLVIDPFISIHQFACIRKGTTTRGLGVRTPLIGSQALEALQQC
jgi:hypothetical protein